MSLAQAVQRHLGALSDAVGDVERRIAAADIL
jgi:hypothetical protein